MFLKRDNGEKVKIERTNGLSSISVSVSEAKKDHDKLVSFFTQQVKKASEKSSQIVPKPEPQKVF